MVNSNSYSRASHCGIILLSFLLLSEASKYRNRRDAGNYVIDTLVVVDDIVFSKWVSFESASQSFQQRQEEATSKLKTYVSLVIHQANDRLKTLDDQGEGWSVQMSIAHILVNMNPLATTERISSTNQIDPQAALTALRLWALVENLHTAYDHILLLTGETFDSSSESAFNNVLRGRAYVGTMCNRQGYSVSFVKEIGGFQSPGYVAHEVAHSLGSVHDGEGNSSDCSSADRYIMAVADGADVTTSNKQNPWFFSACTSRSISIFLASPEASCLTTDLEPLKEFVDSRDVVPGLQYDGDAQCQNIYDGNSRLCLGEGFATLDEVCTSMNCLDTSRSTTTSAVCMEYRGADGTPCANGKLCIRGKCVTDSRAPATVVHGVCPFGDSVTPINGMSCSEFVRSSPSSCYDDNIRNSCCTSCESIKTEFEVCPYGDRYGACLQEYCYSIRADGTRYDEDCCGTCSYENTLECVDVPSIEGMSCPEYIQLGGVQGCYNASLAYQCCQSCAEQRNGSEGCEYGDRILGNSCASFISGGGNCNEERSLCCQTCIDYLNSSRPVVRFTCLYSLLLCVVICWFVCALFNGNSLSLL